MLLRTISKIEAAKRKKISFCELPEIIVENLVVWDDYETDYTIFNGIDTAGGKMIVCQIYDKKNSLLYEYGKQKNESKHLYLMGHTNIAMILGYYIV